MIEEILIILSKDRPNPMVELHYNSPFELVIAAILSSQTTDKQVNKVTPQLFKMSSTPASMAKLTIEDIEDAIRTVGLFHKKAHYIKNTSELLATKFQGTIPNTRAQLETLPGVGRKVANVILNTLFHQHVIAVDTHVTRVVNRLGIVNQKNRLRIEKELYLKIPIKYHQHASNMFILHGRYICKAKNPLCTTCPLNQYCAMFLNSVGNGDKIS